MVKGDWNQWRGESHTGVSTDPTALVDQFPAKELPVAWESESIPSDLEGGHGSPVVADGRVYLGLVWHTKVASETRVIDEEVLTSLGYRETSLLGEDLTRQLEGVRRTLSTRLRGEAQEQWIRQWLQEHFNDEQRLILGSWAGWRMGQRRQALDLDLMAKIHQHVNQPFPSVTAMTAWLRGQGATNEDLEKILKAVPDTVAIGKDTVLCLDAGTGKTVWRFEHDGLPTGRAGSSTCAVIGNRVFWPGSKCLYAMDAKDGLLLWQAGVRSGCGSSPLIEGDKVWLQAATLRCYDAAEGHLLWENKEIKGDTSSPILWNTADGERTLVSQCAGRVVGLNPQDGVLRWEVPGGGDSTPVPSGEDLVIMSSAKDVGLRCYHHEAKKAPEVSWSHWWLAARHSSTPVVKDGYVYLMEGGKHLCVRVKDGAVAWESAVESTISSPILVDGKLLCLEENGLYLRLLRATPAKYDPLGRTRVSALWCPTPAPWKGLLVIRRKDRLTCLDLRATRPVE